MPWPWIFWSIFPRTFFVVFCICLKTFLLDFLNNFFKKLGRGFLEYFFQGLWTLIFSKIFLRTLDVDFFKYLWCVFLNIYFFYDRNVFFFLKPQNVDFLKLYLKEFLDHQTWIFQGPSDHITCFFEKNLAMTIKFLVFLEIYFSEQANVHFLKTFRPSDHQTRNQKFNI